MSYARKTVQEGNSRESLIEKIRIDANVGVMVIREMSKDECLRVLAGSRLARLACA